MHFVAEVADVVVTEIVVDGENQSGAEAGVGELVVDTRRVPELKRREFQMRKAADDDDGQREHHADPEQHGKSSDVADAAKEEQRGDHADAHRRQLDAVCRARNEHREVIRKADAARCHRQRRRKQNLKEKEK